MIRTKIWYNIRNNGDGSAQVLLFQSKQLAELDQKYADESFCESLGCVELESKDKVDIICPQIITKENCIDEVKENMEYICTKSEKQQLQNHLDELLINKKDNFSN